MSAPCAACAADGFAFCRHGAAKREGTRFIAEMPLGYDHRAKLALRPGNRIVLTHPDHPALLLSPTGQWVDLLSGAVHPAQTSSTC